MRIPIWTWIIISFVIGFAVGYSFGWIAAVNVFAEKAAKFISINQSLVQDYLWKYSHISGT